MVNRLNEIKKKGFAMVRTDVEPYAPILNNRQVTDYSKVKLGTRTLEDAVFKLGDLPDANPRLADKGFVLDALDRKDLKALREISNFFYRVSGIYSRLCRYMAFLYKYDWLITPYIMSDTMKKTTGSDKVIKTFNDALYYLDNSNLKELFGDIALQVMKNGCYYGYMMPQSNRMVVQELPVSYCRSRFKIAGRPVIEMNMKYFNDTFRSTEQRQRMLKVFGPDFQKGYRLYMQNKLVTDIPGDDSGWYTLDPECAIKFNLNGVDYPPFASIIPDIIDLDAAQDLDRKKMAQQLLKIVIQKMPLDKNGELIFDVDEAAQLHNNAVQMLGRAIGIDVLTTFAEVDVADLADSNTSTTTDELEKVERTIYNDAGVSQLQFNSDGNIALQYSIANDEASMYNLVAQFENFLNKIIEKYNKNPKKFYFRAQILPTTIYNYKDLAKQYKEHRQIGYSAILPQLALGQSQSSILATATFENEILNLSEIFVPPMSSNTMSNKVDTKSNSTNKSGTTTTASGTATTSSSSVGRPEKDDSEKSEKTMKNLESQS